MSEFLLTFDLGDGSTIKDLQPGSELDCMVASLFFGWEVWQERPGRPDSVIITNQPDAFYLPTKPEAGRGPKARIIFNCEEKRFCSPGYANEWFRPSFDPATEREVVLELVKRGWLVNLRHTDPESMPWLIEDSHKDTIIKAPCYGNLTYTRTMTEADYRRRFHRKAIAYGDTMGEVVCKLALYTVLVEQSVTEMLARQDAEAAAASSIPVEAA